MSSTGAIGEIFLVLFVMFLAAKVAAEIMARLGQPTVIGELMAGIILGPSLLHIVKGSDVFEVLSNLGVIILLFMVGLETRFQDLRKVGAVATLVAFLGVGIPFGLGFVLFMVLEGDIVIACFVGAALVATSVGITARVLKELDVLNTVEARIILAAAIADDVLGLIVLTIVIGIGSGGIEPLTIATLIIESLLFVVILMVIGSRIIDTFAGERPLKIGGRIYSKDSDLLGRMFSHEGVFVAALIICFGLSALAQVIGLASIIGAFLAGMAFSNVKDRYKLTENVRPISVLLVPFFFVVTGAKVDMTVFFGSGDAIYLVLLTIVITLLAIMGKYFGCGLGAWSLGPRSRRIIGIGMVPRGEVGIIVAALGLSMGILDDGLFSVIVLMAIITTLMAPPLLKWAYSSSNIDPGTSRDGGPKGATGKDVPDKTVPGPPSTKSPYSGKGREKGKGKGWEPLDGKETAVGKKVGRRSQGP